MKQSKTMKKLLFGLLMMFVVGASVEAQKFYNENKARIQTEFKDAKDDILRYLRYQRQQELARKLAERLRAAAQVKVLAKPSVPASEADRARVLAVVNGKQITIADIETSLRPL